MRVTDGMRLDLVTRTVTSLSAQQLDAQEAAATGLRVKHVSDDPVAAAHLVRIQAAADSTDMYRKAIAAGQGDLEASETFLSSAGDLLAEATELATRGSSEQLTDDERLALSQQVSSLWDQLLQTANQKGAQGYLFGGAKSDTPPFDEEGNYQGDSSDRTAQIGPNLSAVVSPGGAVAFTSVGGRDVFADIQALKSALLANDPTAVASTVNALDTSRRQILAARVDVGMKLTRLETADSAHQQAQQIIAAQQKEVAEVDPAKAYSQLMAVQHAVEQAIAVAKTTLGSMSDHGIT